MLDANRAAPRQHAPKQASGHPEHPRTGLLRRALPVPTIANPTPFGEASSTLWKWAPTTYPGIERGMVATLQSRAAIDTIRDWRSGRRRAPKWAWGLIAIEAEKRAQELLRVAELAKKEAGD